jgi:hypothetical protein
VLAGMIGRTGAGGGPWFWLGTGAADRQDVRAAQAFQQAMLTRQPSLQLHLEAAGAHSMATWRALMPPLLEWITPRLAAAAGHSPSRGSHRGQTPPQPGSSASPSASASPSPSAVRSTPPRHP